MECSTNLNEINGSAVVKKAMNTTMERFRFFTRKQQEDETLDAFVEALTNLSLTCDFGELRDALVKDILICGLADENYALRERLLLDDPSSTIDAVTVAKNHQLFFIKREPKRETKMCNNVRDERCRRGRDRCASCGGPHDSENCIMLENSGPSGDSSDICPMMKVEVDCSQDAAEEMMENFPNSSPFHETRLHDFTTGSSAKLPKKRRTFQCRFCETVYFSQSELKSHMKTHSSQKPFSCRECGKSFKYKHHLTRHARIHTGERPHMCAECGKCFIQESALYVHLKTHSNEKPYSCNYCEKSFRQKLYLIVHMRIHTGEKPHQCHYCGKCFSQKSALNVHVRCHTGETPYHCDICGKAFVHKVDYNTHIITHTGETPHKCENCGKSFSTKAVLKKHTRKHTGERPFECKTCGKNFSFKHHLIRHSKLHGGVLTSSQIPILCV